MRKKNRRLFVIGIIIFVIILFAFFLSMPQSNTIKPLALTEPGGTTCEFTRGSKPDIYSCNSGYGCNAWIESKLCTTQTSQVTVFARTNKDFSNPSTLSASDTWFSWDTVSGGDLEVYQKATLPTSGTCNWNYDLTFITSIGNFYHSTSGDVIFKKQTESQTNYCANPNYYYTKISSPTNAQKNSFFVTGDIDGVNVKKSSTSQKPYYCEENYYLTKNGLTSTKKISCGGDSQCYYGLSENDAESLDKMDSLQLGAGGIIDYKEKICTLCQCTNKFCDSLNQAGYSLGYKTCDNKDSDTGCGVPSVQTYSCTDPGYVCIGQYNECMKPFNLELKIGTCSSPGICSYTSGNIFKPGDNINTELNINSYLTQKKNVIYQLYQGSIPIGNPRTQEANLPFSPGTVLSQDWGTIPLGNYKIKAYIDNDNYMSERNFAVSQDLCPIAVWADKTRFTTNKDMVIHLYVYDENCQNGNLLATELSQVNATAKLDGKPISFVSSEQIGLGTFDYTVNLNKTGFFTAVFTISRPNSPIKIMDIEPKNIVQPSLLVTTDYPAISQIGTYNLKFTVKGEDAQLIVPDSIVMEVYASTSKITETYAGDKILGDNGQYNVDVHFDAEDTYQVLIKVTKQGYTPYQIPTNIDVTDIQLCGNGICDPGETKSNCVQDCGGNWWDNYLIYGGIAIGILILILFIYLIAKSRKKSSWEDLGI